MSTISVMIMFWFFAPPLTNQHPLTLSITPWTSLAVTLSARFGAAEATRVISLTGLGCCSGVWILVFESWFLRMLSTRLSTLGFGGFGLGGAGLGGSTFFTSGLGSTLGGSGGFSILGGSGSLVF